MRIIIKYLDFLIREVWVCKRRFCKLSEPDRVVSEPVYLYSRMLWLIDCVIALFSIQISIMFKRSMPVLIVASENKRVWLYIYLIDYIPYIPHLIIYLLFSIWWRILNVSFCIHICLQRPFYLKYFQ